MNKESAEQLLKYIENMVDFHRGHVPLYLTKEQAEWIYLLVRAETVIMD